jgi:hypothetical protein
MERLFDKLVSDTEAEYQRLGLALGWRFLTCSAANLSPKTEVLFITLNPGGSIARPDHPAASCEQGSAYLVESWSGAAPGQSKLQRQVQAMFEFIDVDMNSVLSGQLVPFRSPSWADLPRQDECLAFGRSLWGEIIAHVQPSLIIAMGKGQLRPVIRDILGEPAESSDIPAGWGTISAGLDSYPNTRVVSLPHLSRFGIMTRWQSQPALQTLFARPST